MMLVGSIVGYSIQREVLIETVSESYLSKPIKKEFGLAGSSSAPGSTGKSRTGHTAFLVKTHQSHRVIVIGGKSNSGFVREVEIYLPEYGRWKLRAELPSAKSGHLSAVIAGERILLSGEGDESGVSAMSYLYDPMSDIWREASHLKSGEVYVTGGFRLNPVDSIEVYRRGEGGGSTAESVVSDQKLKLPDLFASRRVSY